jgi:hypothetical protein
MTLTKVVSLFAVYTCLIRRQVTIEKKMREPGSPPDDR